MVAKKNKNMKLPKIKVITIAYIFYGLIGFGILIAGLWFIWEMST